MEFDTALRWAQLSLSGCSIVVGGLAWWNFHPPRWTHKVFFAIQEGIVFVLWVFVFQQTSQNSNFFLIDLALMTLLLGLLPFPHKRSLLHPIMGVAIFCLSGVLVFL